MVTVKVEEAAPTETPSPTAAPQPTVTPAPAEPTSPASSETPVTVNAQIIEENTDTGQTVIEIRVDDLPPGTTSVQLPDGTVVPLTGGDTLTLTVSADMIEDGKVQLVALDDEGVPLGNLEAQTDNDVLIDVSDAAGGVMNALWWVLGSAAAVVIIALAVYLVMRKKRDDAGA
jgi:hypothetical protein